MKTLTGSMCGSTNSKYWHHDRCHTMRTQIPVLFSTATHTSSSHLTGTVAYSTLQIPLNIGAALDSRTAVRPLHYEPSNWQVNVAKFWEKHKCTRGSRLKETGACINTHPHPHLRLDAAPHPFTHSTDVCSSYLPCPTSLSLPFTLTSSIPA